MLHMTREIPGTRVLGPAPLPIAKVGGVWRYRVTIEAPEKSPIRPAVRHALIECNNNKNYRGVSLYADFNPLD